MWRPGTPDSGVPLLVCSLRGAATRPACFIALLSADPRSPRTPRDSTGAVDEDDAHHAKRRRRGETLYFSDSSQNGPRQPQSVATSLCSLIAISKVLLTTPSVCGPQMSSASCPHRRHALSSATDARPPDHPKGTKRRRDTPLENCPKRLRTMGSKSDHHGLHRHHRGVDLRLPL